MHFPHVVTVHRYANRPKYKRTFVAPSSGLFLTCRGGNYAVLIHDYVQDSIILACWSLKGLSHEN